MNSFLSILFPLLFFRLIRRMTLRRREWIMLKRAPEKYDPTPDPQGWGRTVRAVFEVEQLGSGRLGVVNSVCVCELVRACVHTRLLGKISSVKVKRREGVGEMGEMEPCGVRNLLTRWHAE